MGLGLLRSGFTRTAVAAGFVYLRFPRAMPAAAFTAITSFQVILFCEHDITLGGKVIILRVELGRIGHRDKDTGIPVDLFVN